MTDAMKEALRWLSERGGDGVFQRGNVLLCAGEIAPHTYKTWKNLGEVGKVEFYRQGKARRLKVLA